MDESRRRFLQFVAATPVFPFLDLPRDWLDGIRALGAGQAGAAAAPEGAVIANAADAFSVLDFEPAARARTTIGHWTWLSTGGDDDATLRANREGFERYQIRARRLVDVRNVDASVPLLGTKWETPIFLCPLAGHRAYHAEGELATARAARARRHLQILSTMTTTSVEDVNAARGEPVWFQLYHRDDWGQTRELIARVEKAGCPALVFTVDLLGGRNMEQYNRVQRQNQTFCASCHPGGNGFTDLRNRPMVTALSKPALSKPAVPQPEIGTPTWDYVKRLKDATRMKLFIKGIVTREDAELALEHGVDGIHISNHGGRAENSLRPTVQCVSEVAAAVKGRVPVLVDGGFRRGTDVFKALGLGATATGIGRPYIWGLAAFGQEGVEAVLTILRRELELIMRQAGTTTIGQIPRGHVVENVR
jgi:isopentenyl diphosphate isomerase/L-lactate dehydrogenase-like FMN-dependent dehydrogenase